MADWGKITRRSLLIGSAAIAGGVAFGVWQYRRDLPNPLVPDEGQATLNPWILIDQQGVTLVAARAEMGQGVYTTLPALLAEELDVAWEDIRVMHGPAAQAYYNGALMSHGLPINDYERTGWHETMIEAMTVLPKMIGLQVTGGSTSTIDAFEKLRMAGATAREALKMAAADRLNMPLGTLSTRDGMVIAPGGIELSYAELAEQAAQIDPPRRVALKDASDWRFLGRSMPRTDILAKSTGTAEFGIDVRLPGMKFAALRRNPRLGAGMVRYDDTAALAMPGVERVVNVVDGIAVVASNTWLAMQAADAVEIEWEQATPYPETTDALMDVIRAALDDAPNSMMRDDGDIDALEIAPEDREIEAEYTVPWLAHATMEPMNATALFTGDGLELWTGSQSPGLAERRAADAVDLDADQVTCHVTFLGGGFGRRGETDFAVYAARVARAMPGTPVQLTWSREEDMRHDFYRPAAAARMRGVLRGGFATALEGRVAAPSVTHQSVARMTGLNAGGADKGHVEGLFNQPYAIPNYRVTGHLADLDVPVGFWRSVGNSFNGFFMESFMDEMAFAARRDPLAFRLDLARREHAPSAGVLEAVAEMSGWTGDTADGIGRGVAMTYSFHTAVAVVVEVSDQDGEVSIDRAWVACDVGTALDPGIIEAQMSGGVIWGLSAAAMQEITFAGGEVEQWNFPDFDALRLHTAPEVEVRILETQHQLGGVGEPAVPPSMPALANAVYDLTGERIRDLPLSRRLRFVA